MGLEHPDILSKPPDKLPDDMKEAIEHLRRGEIGTLQDAQLERLKNYDILNTDGKTLLDTEQQLRRELDLKIDTAKVRLYTHVDAWDGKVSSPYSKEELREDRRMTADGTDTRETREGKLEEFREAQEVKEELQSIKLRKDPNRRWV